MLSLNAENIDVHCDWKGETDRLRVKEAEQEFESLWADENPSLRVLTLPEAVKKRLIKMAEGVSRPVEIDGTSDVPLQVAPPSALEWLRFALIKDGPPAPGRALGGDGDGPCQALAAPGGGGSPGHRHLAILLSPLRRSGFRKDYRSRPHHPLALSPRPH